MKVLCTLFSNHSPMVSIQNGDHSVSVVVSVGNVQQSHDKLVFRLTTVEVKVTDRMNCDVTNGGHVGSTAVNIHCCQRMCDIVDTVTHETPLIPIQRFGYITDYYLHILYIFVTTQQHSLILMQLLSRDNAKLYKHFSQ